MVKAEQMQLRSSLANAHDIAAARQSLSDNVQVLINHHIHLQTSRDKCRSSVLKKPTKMFKSDKPKKTKASQNERLREPTGTDGERVKQSMATQDLDPHEIISGVPKGAVFCGAEEKEL